jgi:hypothetical protein
MSRMFRNRYGRLVVFLATCVAGAAVGRADAQEPKTNTNINRPQLKSNTEGYSSKPAQIVPLLTRSVANMRRAEEIIANARTDQQVDDAAKLILEAYRMQRAAHGGIAIIERGHQAKRSVTAAATMVSQEWAIIDASRKNLLMAHFRFKHAKVTEASRIRSGQEFVGAAIQQTEMALAIH